MKRFFLFLLICTFFTLFLSFGLAEETYTDEIVSITFDSLKEIDLNALLSSLQDAQNGTAPISKTWTDTDGATYVLTYYPDASCLTDGSLPQAPEQTDVSPALSPDDLNQIAEWAMKQLLHEAEESVEPQIIYESTVYWTAQPAPVPTLNPAVFWTAQPAPAPTIDPSVFCTACPAPAPTVRPTAYRTACPVVYCTAVPVFVQQPSSCETAAYQPMPTDAPTQRPAAQSLVSPTVSTGDYTTFNSTMQEQKLLNLLNQDRARNGLPPLALDPELSRLAQLKSNDMNSNHYFAHESPTYGSAAQMLNTFQYDYKGVGENIAHHANVEKAEAAFMSSAGHRQNILGSQWDKVGLGVTYDENGYVYVTELFAR